ncbi:MAG TPA: gliding motility-associated ABC transporter permease subunit GldF, partial [Algoriphagus sp.]|nr:gliding motility-associated ABC transporter permease subunit GldF [Algoriphagus sp.]
FVLGVFLCFLIYFGFTAIADLQLGAISYWIEEISLSYHYVNLSRGVIDSSDLFFLAGMIWLFLGASILVLKNK